MDVKVLETQKWLNNTYGGKAGFSKFSDDELDGITGNGTFKRLIQALQIEINSQYGGSVTVDGDFGNGTLKALPSRITRSNKVSNIVHIIQASLWCKGYNAGEMDGIYGDSTASAVRKFQADAGIAQDGDVKPYILQGIMNTDGYVYKGEKDCDAYYKHMIQKNMNLYYGEKIGLTAPNGEWERKSHKNYIKCCQIEWGLTADGVFGNGTMNKAPTLSVKKTGYTASKRLLKWGLTINGFYPRDLDGTFDNNTYNAVFEFQKFLCLGADGIAGKNTWASLLSSRGNTARAATACDTSTQLTLEMAKSLKAAGYTDVGRYLTNVSGGTLNKKLTSDEINNLAAADMRVFPIYQTTGRNNTYFTKAQGKNDAKSAKEAAARLGFQNSTVIYFAADYDVLVADLDTYLIPYFKGVNETLGNKYKVGVYGPRMLCNKLEELNLAEASFVSDMSSGFTGNIGQKMPSNWRYDQFYETKCGNLNIDKCIASPLSTAIESKYIVPEENYVDSIELLKELYDYAVRYLKEKNGYEPSISETNLFLLQYLRTNAYGTGYKLGTAWNSLAGKRDELFESKITYKQLWNGSDELIPIEEFYIYTARDHVTLPIEHFAATLNAYIYNSAAIDEKVIDAYTGWAGDLHQLAAAIYAKDENIFSEGKFCDYMFPDDNVRGKYGFSLEDLRQDADAFNMYKVYDFNNMKLYEIISDYYYVNRLYEKRYSLFKENLLREFTADALEDVLIPFVDGQYTEYNMFEEAFGKYSRKYRDVITQTFIGCLEELISNESV